MKTLLLIQRDSPLKDYIELYLKAFHDVCLIQANSVNEALAELNNNLFFDCIFIGNSLVKDGESKDLVAKIKNYLSEHTHCKIVGTNKGLSTQDWVQYVPELAPPAKIFNVVRIGLNLTEENSARTFVPVPIICFNYIVDTPADIYLGIGNSVEEMTYVKRFNKNDRLDKQDLNKYIEKKIKYVYVPSEDFNAVSRIISTEITGRLSVSERDKPTTEVIGEAFDYATYVLNSLGISLATQEIAQKLINDIIISASKLDTRKAKQFQDILKTKESFYHKHVSLTAILATSLLEELSWDSDSNKATVTYAAFFQNFFINEEQDISCHREEDVLLLPSEEKRTKVLNHAKLAREFIKDLMDAPYDAQSVILEHHGAHSGVGFPVIKSNTNQISCLFMIINEFALNLLLEFEKNSGENTQALLKAALVTYGDSNLKILEALQNSMTRYLNEC